MSEAEKNTVEYVDASALDDDQLGEISGGSARRPEVCPYCNQGDKISKRINRVAKTMVWFCVRCGRVIGA